MSGYFHAELRRSLIRMAVMLTCFIMESSATNGTELQFCPDLHFTNKQHKKDREEKETPLCQFAVRWF
jgi:hypothetical protein